MSMFDFLKNTNESSDSKTEDVKHVCYTVYIVEPI